MFWGSSKRRNHDEDMTLGEYFIFSLVCTLICISSIEAFQQTILNLLVHSFHKRVTEHFLSTLDFQTVY